MKAVLINTNTCDYGSTVLSVLEFRLAFVYTESTIDDDLPDDGLNSSSSLSVVKAENQIVCVAGIDGVEPEIAQCINDATV